jgi:DNA-binding NtrC family response regulator
MRRLLIVDDDLGSRESLREVFHGQFAVSAVESATEGLAALSQQRPDLIILDLVMPKVSGSKFLRAVREIHPDLPVIVITASPDDSLIQAALQTGAAAALRKPWSVYELRHAVDQCLRADDSSRIREILTQEITRDFPLTSPVGQSPAFRRLLEMAKAASSSHALLIGERGVGKEYIARQMHTWSRRAAEPFVTVACGDLPAGFIEAEIFGVSPPPGEAPRQRGVLELAHGSTLFLENIHHLPATVQSALARLLRHGTYQRHGSSQEVPSDVVILATMEPSQGTLVPGLTDAFAAATLTIPPLRERREDIPLLAHHFLHQLRISLQATTQDIEAEAMQLLREYPWPGNLRELRNVLERVLVVHGHDRAVAATSLPIEFLSGPGDSADAPDFERSVHAFERRLIIQALETSNGTVTDAARVLRTTPRKLQLRIDRLGIRRPSL